MREYEGGDEVQRGWAEGPYTKDQISDILGDSKWVAARRFGVIQGQKCRQIDDFSRFFVNGCTTCDEHIDLDGVDQTVNLAKTWIDLIEEAKARDGWFTARWEDGKETKH